MNEPDPNDPPYRIEWLSVWEEDLDGFHYYELPNGDTLWSGDTFWDAERQCLIEVTAVKAKVRAGPHGQPLESTDDYPHYVFFEDDAADEMAPHIPPRHRDYRDNNRYTGVPRFVNNLDDDVFIPHTDNGKPKLP